MPRTWPPPTPAITDATSTPAIASASPTACLIASTVESMLTTTPLRRPREALAPTPTMSRSPLGDHSAMTQQILVVPTSSPAMICRPFALGMVSPSLRCRVSEHDLVAEAQIDGRSASRPACRAAPARPAARPSRASQSSLPSRTSMPSTRVEHRAFGAAHVDLGDLPSSELLARSSSARSATRPRRRARLGAPGASAPSSSRQAADAPARGAPRRATRRRGPRLPRRSSAGGRRARR